MPEQRNTENERRDEKRVQILAVLAVLILVTIALVMLVRERQERMNAADVPVSTAANEAVSVPTASANAASIYPANVRTAFDEIRRKVAEGEMTPQDADTATAKLMDDVPTP
ncbi:MAG TPA: hypothetical protein VFS75_00435 [Candidatus Paceibacterota bacterium]|nr:hypothetical protein [Candidatus Paceibacterota bacterium]